MGDGNGGKIPGLQEAGRRCRMRKRSPPPGGHRVGAPPARCPGGQERTACWQSQVAQAHSAPHVQPSRQRSASQLAQQQGSALGRNASTVFALLRCRN